MNKILLIVTIIICPNCVALAADEDNYFNQLDLIKHIIYENDFNYDKYNHLTLIMRYEKCLGDTSKIENFSARLAIDQGKLRIDYKSPYGITKNEGYRKDLSNSYSRIFVPGKAIIYNDSTNQLWLHPPAGEYMLTSLLEFQSMAPFYPSKEIWGQIRDNVLIPATANMANVKIRTEDDKVIVDTPGGRFCFNGKAAYLLDEFFDVRENNNYTPTLKLKYTYDESHNVYVINYYRFTPNPHISDFYIAGTAHKYSFDDLVSADTFNLHSLNITKTTNVIDYTQNPYVDYVLNDQKVVNDVISKSFENIANRDTSSSDSRNSLLTSNNSNYTNITDENSENKLAKHEITNKYVIYGYSTLFIIAIVALFAYKYYLRKAQAS